MLKRLKEAKKLNISKAKFFIEIDFQKSMMSQEVLFQSDSTEYQVLLDEMREQFSFINDNNSWSSFFKNYSRNKIK